MKSGTHGNCAMYPLSTPPWNGYNGWIDYVQHQCADALQTAPLANGCFVDQISSALNSGFATALPVDPATRALYRASTWMAQMGQIGQRIQSFTGKPVVGNSYEAGARYWGVPTNIVNGYGISGFESEHFLNANQTQWTQLAYWTQNVNMMIDGQAHGKGVEVGFTDAPATNEEIWRQYVVASYLLGNNGHAWMAFSSTSKHTYTDPSAVVQAADRQPVSDGRLRVGIPDPPRSVPASLYQRRGHRQPERFQHDRVAGRDVPRCGRQDVLQRHPCVGERHRPQPVAATGGLAATPGRSCKAIMSESSHLIPQHARSRSR